MSELLFSSLAAGVSAGAILLFISHVAPYIGAGNFIRDLDRPHFFGKAMDRREAHFVGMFVHLLVSAIAGVGYGFLVDIGVVSGFGLFPLLGWSMILTLIIGGILLPLEGHGLFGVKEDAWFPVDLLLSCGFWGMLFYGIMAVWFTAVA